MEIQDRICELEKEADRLSREMTALYKEIRHIKQEIGTGCEQAAEAPSLPYEPEPAPRENRHEVRASKDIEKTIGKSWMAVFASGLIFVSIIMFATLLIPRMGDGFKIAVMFVFSLGLTAVSYLKLRRHSDNRLWIALEGCGVGSILISLFVTRIFFNAIGDITLYILIVLWSAGICLLSRYQNTVFQVIGQLGLAFAVVMGSLKSLDIRGDVAIITVTLFYVLTQCVFYFSHIRSSSRGNIASHAGVIFNASFILIVNVFSEVTAVAVIVSVFVVLYIAANICLADTRDDRSLRFGLLWVFSLFPIIIAELEAMDILELEYDTAFILPTYVIFAAMTAMCHLKTRSGRPVLGRCNKLIVQISTLICATVLIWYTRDTAFVNGILGIIVLCLAIVFTDRIYQWAGIVYLFLFSSIVAEHSENVPVCVILGIVLIALEVVSLLRKYRTEIKYGLVIMTYIWIIVIVGYSSISMESYSVPMCFMVITVIHIVLSLSRFSRNWLTGEDEKLFGIFMGIIGSILVVATIPVMYIDSVLYYAVIPVAVALYLLNIRRLLQHESFYINMYAGLKFTVLLYVILDSMKIGSIWISVACLLLAIGCVVLGFRLKNKGLRIYGLVLANISVVKLILIDVDYYEPVSQAVGFFVCGVLCFAVSYIYSRIEKQNKTGNDKIRGNSYGEQDKG